MVWHSFIPCFIQLNNPKQNPVVHLMKQSNRERKITLKNKTELEQPQTTYQNFQLVLPSGSEKAMVHTSQFVCTIYATYTFL